MTSKHPDWFPPHCPPNHATDANGHVFRIVQGRPLGASDFKTHHEAKTAPHAPPCERCGISVFNSFENAAHRQRLSPRLGTAIAKGTLQSDAGKILLTNVKSGHMEWWPYQGVDRASYFFEVLSCNI